MLHFEEFFTLVVGEEDNFANHCSRWSYRANYLKS